VGAAALDLLKSLFGPDSVSGETLKFGGEAMITYLGRLLDIINNDTNQSDWKKATGLTIY
jgi:hypothetical protein